MLPRRSSVLLRAPAGLLTAGFLAVAGSTTAIATGDLGRVNHIIVVMQENHSFDNYLGVLPYTPGGPYHGPRAWRPGRQGCDADDHRCVDGLQCAAGGPADLTCFDSNPDDDGDRVFAFHDPRRCVVPDLDHSWAGTHREIDYDHPRATLLLGPNDGYVRVNGAGGATNDTIGFYNQDDLPFYYALAQDFAISDRYFASVPGPTFPNRSYLMAATSFGHLTTNDILPPRGGYRPVTGTIFDLLESHGVTWANYYQNLPQGASFRPFGLPARDPHFARLAAFLAQAAGIRGAAPLPQVAFVDPNFGPTGIFPGENDEHPPTDIQRGQAFVSRVVNAVRNGPYWQDAIIIITYDEHGGFYDHVKPPRAAQGGRPNPDGIAPGQCADLSDPPASLAPGGGARCATNLLSRTDTSVKDAEELCPALALDPTGPYPWACPNFNQLGVRVPFIAVSPFSKPSYVSHTIGDHASILALIEKRFAPTPDGGHQYLTARDQYADTLEDLFDFEHAPSLGTRVSRAMPPADDCTP